MPLAPTPDLERFFTSDAPGGGLGVQVGEFPPPRGFGSGLVQTPPSLDRGGEGSVQWAEGHGQQLMEEKQRLDTVKEVGKIILQNVEESSGVSQSSIECFSTDCLEAEDWHTVVAIDEEMKSSSIEILGEDLYASSIPLSENVRRDSSHGLQSEPPLESEMSPIESAAERLEGDSEQSVVREVDGRENFCGHLEMPVEENNENVVCSQEDTREEGGLQAEEITEGRDGGEGETVLREKAGGNELEGMVKTVVSIVAFFSGSAILVVTAVPVVEHLLQSGFI